MADKPNSIERTMQQARTAEIETIRQALIAGELSGEPEWFDYAAFKRRKAAQSLRQASPDA